MPCKTSFSYFAGPAKATLHGVVLKIFEKGRFFDLIDENGGEPGVRLEGSGNRRNNNGVWLKAKPRPQARSRRDPALSGAQPMTAQERVLLISLSPRAAPRRVATAQQRGQPTHEQLQLEFQKFSQDRTDPLMHLGWFARLFVHVRPKRKAWPVNHTAPPVG